jgi:uncharacterized protein YeaO (DUF488 family)
MIYTGQTYKEGNKPSRQYDEVWNIMRYPTKGIALPSVHHPELAPSELLYRRYLELKEVGEWGPKAFKEIYVPEYIRQMAASREAGDSLNYLFKNRGSGKDILLLCSCADESTCHRSIVSGLLDTKGEYYGMYKEALAKYKSGK